MGVWWQVVVFSVYRQNDEFPLCIPLHSKEGHAHSLHRVLKRRNPLLKNGYLAGRWKLKSLHLGRSIKERYLPLHSCCIFQPCHVCSKELSNFIAKFGSNHLVLEEHSLMKLTIPCDVTLGVRILHPGILLWWNEENDHLPVRKFCLHSCHDFKGKHLQRKTCLILEKRNMQTRILNV